MLMSLTAFEKTTSVLSSSHRIKFLKKQLINDSGFYRVALLKGCKVTWALVLALYLAPELLFQASAEPQVPCFHIFGDSTSDPGNNNDLITLAKANYLPYGVDFPTKVSTGRFCNGLLVVDYMAKLLGFDDYIPPFTTATDEEILRGVNYASGAAGIRDETGRTQGDRFSMNRQLLNHKAIVSRIATKLGSNEAAEEHLNQCLYYVAIGSNDYINNYFMPAYYPTSTQYSVDGYAADLIQKLSAQLKILYNYGARKVVVVTLGALGDTPVELITLDANATEIDDAVGLFNVRLKPLIDALNSNLTHAFFTYINATQVSESSSFTSAAAGFTVTEAPCCELGLSIFTCKPFDMDICSNRTEYVYFDNVHPTQEVNLLFANGFYNASSSEAYPYNIRDLAQMVIPSPSSHYLQLFSLDNIVGHVSKFLYNNIVGHVSKFLYNLSNLLIDGARSGYLQNFVTN